MGASQITLTGVEYVSFYDSQHQVSQRMTLADFLEALTVGEKEVPMTYEPVIESLAVNLNSSTGKHTLTVTGSGISNATDYQAVHVNLYTAGFADRLSLVGGNLERRFEA